VRLSYKGSEIVVALPGSTVYGHQCLDDVYYELMPLDHGPAENDGDGQSGQALIYAFPGAELFDCYGDTVVEL